MIFGSALRGPALPRARAEDTGDVALACRRRHRDDVTSAKPKRVDMIERYLARADLPADAHALAVTRSAGLMQRSLACGALACRRCATRWRHAARFNWPRDIPRTQRRSVLRLAYASAQPLRGAARCPRSCSRPVIVGAPSLNRLSASAILNDRVMAPGPNPVTPSRHQPVFTACRCKLGRSPVRPLLARHCPP